MKNRQLRSNLILFLTAIIWGFAFVAQSVGMKYVGAFTFNGIRFLLGAVSLLPLLLFLKSKKSTDAPAVSRRRVIGSGTAAGTVLFLAATLQQAGLAYTSAGKAAFLTGLYIILVPILGIFLRHKAEINTWIGVVLAVLGLYLLSVKGDFSVEFGDLLEIIGAFFWAIHILLIDRFTKKIDAISLSFVQFLMCSVLSIAAAFLFETVSLQGIFSAGVPILYGGLLSVGVAYTLQVVGQKHAKPSHAAIIMSLESVFAAIGGAILLHENLGIRGYIGCALMLSGMVVTQLRFPKRERTEI